jgi:tellurite resistance-related uncharacterized protein
VIRTIEGFHPDEVGEWVAELSCLHGQHVRHQPPFRERPWVVTEAGRAAAVGTTIDCPLCDRAELPSGLSVVRTAGPWGASTMPAALQRDHRVAEHLWGRLRVLAGSIGFELATVPPVSVVLTVGDEQPIPPGVPHRVVPHGDGRVAVDFLACHVP